jgi:hypothetical protein
MGIYDFYHIFNFNIFADVVEAIHVNRTMVMELAGINMAAIIGFNSARTAKNKPTTL